MKVFKFIPLFLIVFIVYNAIVFSPASYLLIEPEIEDDPAVTESTPAPAAVTEPALTPTPTPPVEVAEEAVEAVTDATADVVEAAPETLNEAVEAVEEAAPETEAAPEPAAAEAKPERRRPVPLATIPLISGAQWKPLLSDILLIFAVLILYFELFKATKTNVSSIVEHVLSMFVFIAFLVEFLVVKECGTSTFLIVTMLSLIDVIGGFTITISTARRDFAHGGLHE